MNQLNLPELEARKDRDVIVLNHGTLNRLAEDGNIITILARTLGYAGDSGGSDKMDFTSHADGVYVTNGVGSAALDRDLLRLGHINKARSVSKLEPQFLHAGVQDGKEVIENVNDYVQALTVYRNRFNRFPYFIDLVGYSRGAVTCFKMMNQERQFAGNSAWKDFRPYYRIFAIDPVPGITVSDNAHMWDDVEISNQNGLDKRTHCFILLAEGERREAFTPMLPAQMRIKGHKDRFDYDTMPGKHVAMCGSEGNDQAPMFDLIKDRVALYLDESGAYNNLPRMMLANNWTRLERYSEISNGLYFSGISGGISQTKGGFMNQGGYMGAAETILAESEYQTGRRFHVPIQGSNVPKKAGMFGADGNKSIRENNQIISPWKMRSDKLSKRSLSGPRAIVRVFVNTAHKKLFQRVRPNYFPDVTNMDKGVWLNTGRRKLEALANDPEVRQTKHVSSWVRRLIEDGPWERENRG